MTETKAATIADVAALAGVSIGTVSKAVNGTGQLRAQTRDRVLAAADQLSFRPSPLARGLLAGARRRDGGGITRRQSARDTS